MSDEMRLDLGGAAGAPAAAYRLAGRRLLVRPPLAELAPFVESASRGGDEAGARPPSHGAQRRGERPPTDARDAAGIAATHRPVGAGDGLVAGPPVFDGEGWVGGQWRRVACRPDEHGYRLEVAGTDGLRVAAGGRRIDAIEPVREPGGALVQAALGPALCLALALDGVYCLHAAAVSVDGAAVVLMGPSGSGKSTLAARLATGGPSGWQRVADDIVPLAGVPAGAVARPHFPQLKLPAAEQWGAERPDRLPVAAIYRLRLAGPEEPLAVRPLGARDGALALVRHTVAGLLFDAGLRARHLDFAVALATRVGVRELVVPRGERLPDGLAGRLSADVASGSPG